MTHSKAGMSEFSGNVSVRAEGEWQVQQMEECCRSFSVRMIAAHEIQALYERQFQEKVAKTDSKNRDMHNTDTENYETLTQFPLAKSHIFKDYDNKSQL